MNEQALLNVILQYAQEIGWEYIPPEDALLQRESDRFLYLYPTLEEQLTKLNPGVVNTARAKEIIRQLNLIKPNIEGNRHALSWIRGEQTVFVSEQQRLHPVRLVDFEKPRNNIFQFTNEWRQTGTAYTARADLVFLINGIPIAMVETKSSIHNILTSALPQIQHYHEIIPKLFTSTQIFAIIESLNFFYGATWNTNPHSLCKWKDESTDSFEYQVKSFFNPSHLLGLLRDYIIFQNQASKLTKVILRQHQIRAVEKTIQWLHKPSKKHGLIWHAQGSGKRLTMIALANKILREIGKSSERPTVLMLVDRKEREAQLASTIASCGFTNFEVAQSKHELQRILNWDYRGLVVSTIQKFHEIPENINTRESFFILIEEAHRNTSGILLEYLITSLPNSTCIGFTDMPIRKLSDWKSIFTVSKQENEQSYIIDKYSLEEATNDGILLPIKYVPAFSELQVYQDTLEEEFFSLNQTDKIIEEDELSIILNRNRPLVARLKAHDRINQIAAYIAQHFKDNVEPMGFKACLIAADREACALYKDALDQYIPPEYSQIICSTTPHYRDLLRKLSVKPQEGQDIIRSFCRKEELPKILIFTEQLLTGFDVPILYCLYLDKPLRDHSLLQAISRINRPYDDGNGLVKTSGLLVDFIGIYQELEKALADETQAKVENKVEELAREDAKAEAERQALGVDENTFAIYTTLKPVIRTLSAEQAKGINSFFTQFPEFLWNQQQNRQLRIQLYKTLQPFVEPQKMIEITNELLKLKRI